MNLRSLLALVLPYRRTTVEEVLDAMLACGISPDEIAWRVGDDGSFAFGAKDPNSGGISYEQTSHLLAWAKRRRVKVGFLASERTAN